MKNQMQKLGFAKKLLFKSFLIALCINWMPNFIYAQTAGQAGDTHESEQSADENRQNDCVRYLQDTRSPEHHHKQMEHRPLFVVGTAGTEVLIPADAFVHEDGSPVVGDVEVLFREVVNKPGMILNNLPTNSNGRMLVSGGVINLEAVSDGKKLKLAAGKTVLVNFPMGHVEGMELFKGRYDAAGKLNWLPIASPAGTTSARGTNLEAAEKVLPPAFLDFGTVDPNTFLFADGETQVHAYMKTVLKENYPCTGNDAVYLEMKLDENGRVKEAAAVTGKNPCYRMAIMEIAQTLVFDKELVAARNSKDPLTFEIKPIIPMTYKKGENLFTPRFGDAAFANDPALKKVLQEFMDEEKAVNFAKNALAINELGLVNCDRFYDTPASERGIVTAKVDNKGRENHTKAFIVFDDLNSAMEGELGQGGQYTFRNIPKNMKARIVVIGYSKEEGPSLAMQKINTSSNAEGVMSLKPVTEEALQQALAGI